MSYYREYIAEAAKNNQKQVIFNPDSDHAADIMKHLFENAHDCVKIFAGSFSGEISGDPRYFEGLENMLRRGVKLRILVQKDKFKDKPNPKIFRLLRYYSVFNPKQIIIKQHPFKVTQNGFEVHFTIADGMMCRIEGDIEKFSAKCNYNDEEASQQLNQKFDAIFSNEKAEIVDLYKDLQPA